MTNRAAIYVRISKDTEGLGLGVERQETECRELAERLELDIVNVHADNDVSAYSGAPRPGYDALVESMKARSIDTVICWHPDRLTRRPTDLETLIDVLEATGVNVVTVSAGTYDLATPAGRMQSRVIGATARYESEQKASRLRSKFDQMAAAGTAPAGRAPYGYRRDGNTYVIEEAEADHLRWMADRVLEGRSLLSIARELTDRGVPTKLGRPWHHSTVRTSLLNPAMAGLRVHRREIAGPGDWSPILDRATWDAVRNVLADPARKRRRPARKYPLSGLLVNENGNRLVGRLDHRTGKERTRRTYKTPSGAAPFVQIDADKLEELVFEAVLQRFDGVTLTAPAPLVAGPDVSSIEADLDELAQLRGEGTISLREWLAAREPLEARLAEAVAAQVPTESAEPLLTKPGALRAAWPDLTTDQRRRVLRAALDHIVVTGAGGRGQWAPIVDRVSLAYRD